MPVLREACAFSRPLTFEDPSAFKTPAFLVHHIFFATLFEHNTSLKIFVELVFDKRYLH